jgi:hypothetical protein
MAVERRGLWLGAVLIVALIAVMAVRSMDSGSPVRNRETTRARPAAQATPRESEPELGNVNLEALKRERGEPVDQSRNPFRFRPKAPPPSAMPAPVTKPLNESPGPRLPPGPVGPPPPPPITLKFIGIVQKADGTKIAVLSDGKRPFHGVEGQEIEGQYRLLKIGLEAIEIAYLDGRGRQTIKLTGQ